ncbi:MAG: hypothetical protein QXH07_05485 [Thermoplasmata archaeon]
MEKKIKNAILSDCLSEFETATKPDGDLYKKIFSYLSDVFYQETVKEVEVTDIEYGASYPIYDTQINYNSEDYMTVGDFLEEYTGRKDPNSEDIYGFDIETYDSVIDYMIIEYTKHIINKTLERYGINNNEEDDEYSYYDYFEYFYDKITFSQSRFKEFITNLPFSVIKNYQPLLKEKMNILNNKIRKLLKLIKKIPGKKTIRVIYSKSQKPKAWRYTRFNIDIDKYGKYDPEYEHFFKRLILKTAIEKGAMIFIYQFLKTKTEKIIDNKKTWIPQKKMYGIIVENNTWKPISAEEVKIASIKDSETGEYIGDEEEEGDIIYSNLDEFLKKEG